MELFWKRMLEISGPETSFDVTERNASVKGTYRCRENRARIALGQDKVWRFDCKVGIQLSQQPTKQRRKSLAGDQSTQALVKL